MYADLTSWDNLLLAYQRASRGKRRQPRVAAFEHRLEDHLLALQEELRTQTYRPGAYTHFFIHKDVHFRRQLTRLLTAWRAGDLPVTRVTASVRGWVNHVRYGNTVGLRKAVLGRSASPRQRPDVGLQA